MVAVLVHNGGGDAQGSQRGLEYDTVSGAYATFIETEVLPRITRDYNILFTDDPNGRATMGGNSGAAAAFSMAWFHPEWYRRVLANERMAAALAAKGYDYQYVCSRDSGHTDRAVIAATLPLALEWLWRGYPIQ